jgi:hypothetical protein
MQGFQPSKGWKPCAKDKAAAKPVKFFQERTDTCVQEIVGRTPTC